MNSINIVYTLNMPLYVHLTNNYLLSAYLQGTFGTKVTTINKTGQIPDTLKSSWHETITNRQVFLQEEVKANR